MTYRRLAALALVLAACGPATRAATPKPRWAADTHAAWDTMKQALTGRFRATTAEGRTVETSYRLISKGSALLETFTTASGNETITVYHPDGRALMLTHYCAQGNQARLRATEATADKIVFELLDATNVQTGQGVMHELSFVFRPNGFDQESVYIDSNGASDRTTLHFVRE